MTIEEHNKIDLLTVSKDRSALTMIMIAESPWDNERILDLQSKINLYLDYALGGQLAREYPESAGKSLVFQLDSVHPPTDDVRRFLDLVIQKWLSPSQIRLNVGDIGRDA